MNTKRTNNMAGQRRPVTASRIARTLLVLGASMATPWALAVNSLPGGLFLAIGFSIG